MYKNQMLEEYMIQEYVELIIDDLVDKLIESGIPYYVIIDVIRSYDYNYIEG